MAGPRHAPFLGLQATLGGATLTLLLNPVFWALTCVYLVAGPGPIAALFPMPVLYLGVTAMLAGNFLMIYMLMMGCMERGLLRAVPAMLVIPVYWAMMSVAAYKALGQLLIPGRRHYWELTRHGLVADTAAGTALAPPPEGQPAYADAGGIAPPTM